MKTHEEDFEPYSWDFDPAKQQPALLNAWRDFIERGKINSDIVRNCIADSWRRSQEYGVDPNRIQIRGQLDPESYRRRIANNGQLINLASPIIENLFESLGGSRYIVSLYDSDGYHLMRLAQPEDLRFREKQGLRMGLCFDEHSLGTTGFSLAKQMKRSVRMTGCEHYNSILHHINGVYAPIFNPRTENITGVIAVGGKVLVEYPQAESIVVAASTAIENLIELDQAKREMVIYSESLQIAIDSLEDGVVIVGQDGRIREMNSAAQKAISLDYYQNQSIYLSELSQCRLLSEIVTHILERPDTQIPRSEYQNKGQTFLVTAKSIRRKNQSVQGVLIQLKNIKTLSRMLHDMTVEQPRYTLDSIIGLDQSIGEIKNLAQIAARTDASVIIEGESGTGKELVAQAIHNAGHRKKSPFVEVNCAAIPSELIESTIFGHIKGAFTGAVRTHIGKFELAHKGTLFLDEIGDMPKTMQAKILKAIEEGKIERVGGETPFSVDVRIVAATNQNLIQLMQQGKFREDLFFRLNVFRIVIPPLRQRKDDIPALTWSIVEEFLPLFEKNVSKISTPYLNRLRDHDWPGNVRELRNAIQFSMARLTGDTLKVEHLDHFFQMQNFEKRSNLAGSEKQEKLAEVTNQLILNAIELHRGDKAKAARSLGISRATLYRKLKAIEK